MNKRFYREFALLLRHFHLINIESAFIWWGCQVGNEKVNKSRLLSFMTMSQYSPFFSNHLLIFTNSITATDQGWGSKNPWEHYLLSGPLQTSSFVVCLGLYLWITSVSIPVISKRSLWTRNDIREPSRVKIMDYGCHLPRYMSWQIHEQLRWWIRTIERTWCCIASINLCVPMAIKQRRM